MPEEDGFKENKPLINDTYEVLGVPKHIEDLKVYKTCYATPDRGGDEAKFKEINEAYDRIKKGNDEPEITDFADFAENFGNF